MVITSTDNSKIIETAKLSEKKYRNRLGKYVLEGVRLVSDALKHGAKAEDIFVAESVAHNFNFVNQTVVSDRVFAKISDTVNSQGVLAVVSKPNVEMTSPNGNCMVLDGLQDPGNVGTLIRTAVACDFTDLYAVNSADLYSSKVIRSAMSAHFCIKLHETDSIEKVFELLHGVSKIAADMSGKNIFETTFPSRVALILGNEGNGISDFVRKHADKTVSLPMANGLESLNVAVAGSVIAYKIFSQNK